MKSIPNKEQAYWALVKSEFPAFVNQAFATLYPNKEFQANWSIQAIIHALERSYRGEIPRLIINLPPRHLKSLLVSIAWPAFLLGRDPTLKIFCVSYSDEIAKAIARDFKRIVEAEWFKLVFPQVKLVKVTEGEVVTDRGGFRAALSVHGSLTGRGADLIIIDDPCRPDDAKSDRARESLNEWFGSTLVSRRDDKKHSGLILVMQRLHVNDLTGHMEQDEGVVKLSFPAIAERDEEIALTHGRVHRRLRGDLLHPELEGVTELRQLKRDLGAFDFEAQYQQSPRTPEGTLFKRKYFELVPVLPDTRYEGDCFISVDTAMATSAASDFTAITVAYVIKGRLYIADVRRGRWEYEDVKDQVLRCIKQHYRVGRPVQVLVEYAGTGLPLYQFLHSASDSRYYVFTSVPRDSKFTRASKTLPWFESRILVWNKEGTNAWVAPFINEFMTFPNGANDDQVDSVVQLIYWNRVRNHLNKVRVFDDCEDAATV